MARPTMRPAAGRRPVQVSFPDDDEGGDPDFVLIKLSDDECYTFHSGKLHGPVNFHSVMAHTNSSYVAADPARIPADALAAMHARGWEPVTRPAPPR
jgi:hypothetical protein